MLAVGQCPTIVEQNRTLRNFNGLVRHFIVNFDPCVYGNAKCHFQLHANPIHRDEHPICLESRLYSRCRGLDIRYRDIPATLALLIRSYIIVASYVGSFMALHPNVRLYIFQTFTDTRNSDCGFQFYLFLHHFCLHCIALCVPTGYFFVSSIVRHFHLASPKFKDGLLQTSGLPADKLSLNYLTTAISFGEFVVFIYKINYRKQPVLQCSNYMSCTTGTFMNNCWMTEVGFSVMHSRFDR